MTHKPTEDLIDYDVSGSATSDENIKRLVVEELYWDSRVDVSKVTVEVTGRVVTLKGHVPTVTDRLSAEADARLIKDVITVENRIEVQQPIIIPDGDLQEIVIQTLDWTPDLNVDGLEVSTKDGTVTIRGAVGSYWEKLQAHLLTGRIHGVFHVIDEIVVTPLETLADKQIGIALERAFEQRLFDDVNSVQITVKNGAVTLRGQVPTASLRQTLQELTERTAGVTAIHNELSVPA